ncbi:hypothetical protein B0H16DRAFT_1782889 [Mycena metata]|uniref:F-box domain-containing protein n=1 Tax=Mycena metata TaxID=1033252 RepID=A0AAD7KEQ2_9AGAR|nr:hypothetical protein B0H16DRAFT_1827637 [Mycena metata]KAJ7784129.1 hypothetical protein B0H16DRAFT_1782889 [Mycena metata]
MSVHADLRARLAEADASIVELKSRLTAVEAVRQQLQSQLDGIVYPVANLPPEITSNIFLRCLPPSPELNKPVKGYPRMSQAPLIFLRICKLWRDIALSTPRLWVDLLLSLEELEMDEDELERRIADWFGRAGTCPLSFSVRGWMGMDAFGSDAISATLRSYAPHLQSICLQLETAHFEAIEDFTGPFPMLENLAVALPFLDEEADSPMLNFQPTFSNAPRLSQLSFTEEATPTMFSYSFDALSKVTCESCPPDDFLFLVECASFLGEFECTIEEDGMYEYSDSDVITGDHLHTLHFMPNCYFHSLQLLRLPALRNLRLSEDIDNPDENHDFLAFLAHSSASLRSFSAEREITTLTVDWFATSMPGLTELDLCQEDDDFLLEFFTMLDRAQNPGFLPHLQSLTFRDCTFSIEAPMFSALSSRTTADDQSSILESFRQIWPKGEYMVLEDATAASFRGLVERGMKIHVGPAHRSRI